MMKLPIWIRTHIIVIKQPPLHLQQQAFIAQEMEWVDIYGIRIIQTVLVIEDYKKISNNKYLKIIILPLLHIIIVFSKLVNI